MARKTGRWLVVDARLKKIVQIYGGARSEDDSQARRAAEQDAHWRNQREERHPTTHRERFTFAPEMEPTLTVVGRSHDRRRRRAMIRRRRTS